MSGTVFINEFFYVTDHASTPLSAGLGNNRLTVRNNNGDAVIVNKTDYYPLGSVAREWTNTAPDIGKFKYQQKERDIETGYDYFEARIFDSQLGRFLQVDPLWEKFSNISPYGAMNNRPNIFTDPTGMAPGGGNGIDDDENDAEGYGSNLTQLNLQKPKTINDGVEIATPIKETIETGVKEAPGKAAKLAGNTSTISGVLAIVCAVVAIPSSGATMPGAVFFSEVAMGAQITETVATGVDLAVNPSEAKKDALIESAVNTGTTMVGSQVAGELTNTFARQGASGRFYQKGTRGSIPSTDGRAIVAATMGLEAAGASAVANIILNFLY